MYTLPFSNLKHNIENIPFFFHIIFKVYTHTHIYIDIHRNTKFALLCEAIPVLWTGFYNFSIIFLC